MGAHSQKITPVAVGSTAEKAVRILARIPRASAQLPHAANLPLPVGDPAEQVLLVEEPSIGLDALPLIAELTIRPDESSEPQPSGNSYFVDVGHGDGNSRLEAAPEPPSVPEESPLPTSTSRHHSHSSSRKRRQHLPQEAARKTTTNSWATNLPQLHARLMPYSGLIVSLALVASASLLYWLVLGPTNQPGDYQGLFTASSSEWPTFSNGSQAVIPVLDASADSTSETIFASEAGTPGFSVPSGDLFSVDAVSEPATQPVMPFDTEMPAEDSQLAKVEPDEISVVQDPVLDGGLPAPDKSGDFLEPLFPTTDFAPLDFSLIGIPMPVAAEKNPRGTPQTMPSVANRNLQTPSSPIRR